MLASTNNFSILIHDLVHFLSHDCKSHTVCGWKEVDKVMNSMKNYCDEEENLENEDGDSIILRLKRAYKGDPLDQNNRNHRHFHIFFFDTYF